MKGTGGGPGEPKVQVPPAGVVSASAAAVGVYRHTSPVFIIDSITRTSQCAVATIAGPTRSRSCRRIRS